MKVGLWETDSGSCAGKRARSGVKAKDDGRNGVFQKLLVSIERGAPARHQRGAFIRRFDVRSAAARLQPYVLSLHLVRWLYF